MEGTPLMDTTQVPSKVFLAPKASGCFLGGAQEIFGAVSVDLLGGAAKAEDAKLKGGGNIPKLCPMERVETKTMNRNESQRPA